MMGPGNRVLWLEDLPQVMDTPASLAVSSHRMIIFDPSDMIPVESFLLWDLDQNTVELTSLAWLPHDRLPKWVQERTQRDLEVLLAPSGTRCINTRTKGSERMAVRIANLEVHGVPGTMNV